MKAIPTAEEFFEEYDLSKAPIEYSSEEGWAYLAGKRDAYKKAIEFAKLHVEAALKAALEDFPCGSSSDTVSHEEAEDAILNAYPLSKIL